MAMTPNQKLKAKHPRRWLIIGDDASLNIGKVLGSYADKAEAYAAKPLFAYVRPETEAEYSDRIGSTSA